MSVFKSITYKSFLKALISFVIYLALNQIFEGVPLSLSGYIAFLSISFNPFVELILFFLANLIAFGFINSLIMLISGIFFLIVFTIYEKIKRKISFEIILYLSIGVIPYILGNFQGEILNKLGYSAVIAIFSIIMMSGFKVAFINRFKRKSTLKESVSLYSSIVIVSLGFIEICSLFIYYIVALTIILFMVRFFKDEKSFIPCFLMAIPMCFYLKNLTPLAIFMLYTISALVFIKYSLLLSGFSVVITQFLILYLCGYMANFTVFNYIFSFLPCLIYLFTPKCLVVYFKKLFTKYSEPKMIREIINRERGEISTKLNSLALSFSDLTKATNSFSGIYLSKEEIMDKIADEIVLNVCGECNMENDCIMNNNPVKDDIKKLISIGFSKGKVTLIDLSRDFSTYCYNTNAMICEINKLVNNNLEELNKIDETKKYKELVSMEANGIYSVLTSLAQEFSQKLNFNEKLQTEIFNNLAYRSIIAENIILTGEEIHIVLNEEKKDFSLIAKIISKTINKHYTLKNKINVDNGILAVFSEAPRFDASFGICQVTKDNSTVSGDTHSLSRIENGKFIVALCDGMGSGEKAFNNSKATISLIEGFLKAGLDDQKTIEITNRLLSVCSEDSFSALDLASFNLYDGSLSTIKIGATYGFLMGKNGIKLIENTSLPMGIVENVTPSFMSLKVDDGDMLIMCSDGITDPFFSSTDAMDFLLTNTSVNPQSVADSILQHALALSDGKALDDMTVIVIKIYKQNN